VLGGVIMGVTGGLQGCFMGCIKGGALWDALRGGMGCCRGGQG
jgi:hypothetical protein